MPTGIDFSLLREQLAQAASRFDVDWLDCCDSTNTCLLARAEEGAASGLVVGTDRQTAGRGRRGRAWLATPGCSLTFSVLWRYPAQVQLQGLSLAVGVAVAEGLEALGARQIQLKWPNDIWLNQAKLGGILIETAPHGSLVIGIGLNLARDPNWEPMVTQPLITLEDAMNTVNPRETILASILRSLATTLDTFGEKGFAVFQQDWCRRNAFLGLPVCVKGERYEEYGICDHVTPEGALILRTEQGERLINHGDVSLRKQAC